MKTVIPIPHIHLHVQVASVFDSEKKKHFEKNEENISEVYFCETYMHVWSSSENDTSL